MPSGIKAQITKAQLIKQLEEMKEGETIEILTEDLIEKHGENEYTLNSDDKFFNLEDLVDMIYCANRPFFIDIPEESEVKDLILGWQSGGNCFLDTIILKNGMQIVVSSDGIGIYKNQEAFENGETLGDYFYE